MGPRPDGRGKQLAVGVLAKPQVGVNGAAARRPRKGAGGGGACVRSCLRQWGRGQTAAESGMTDEIDRIVSSVNGAAARRPRKVRVESATDVQD